MEVRIWGARGSYPASGARFSEFGHHTPCVEVSIGDDLIVLDAGSGAAALGESLRGKPPRRVHILLSHFHHDHVMGLPFLLYGAGDAAITLHAAFGADMPLDAIISRLFSAPYFPGEPGRLLDRLVFRTHPAHGAFAIGDAAVETAPLEHPGGSTAFRLGHAGRSLVYVTDIENRLEPDPALVRLARNAGLLIHDTMYTSDEAGVRSGWGHGTIEAALALADRAGVKQLGGFHHNPLHDDATLNQRENDMATRRPGAFLVREGARFSL